MPTGRQRPDQSPRNSSQQGAELYATVIIHSFEHNTGDSTIWLDSTPILRENTLWESTPCRKDIIHLQISIPSPEFEPKPYGTADSVTNHYKRWAS
ncbi:hypothetical protein TNCV_1026131 [Trichonephila clavipes]|nr:hypothetical protein TNCV_1026131 [Trichonephila clavipes]